MPWPPAYNPVYNLHVRLPEPSLHANPLIQTPPIPHLEGSHPIQWLMSDPKQLSSTVLGDSLRFALKDHDSGKLIPHLPIPLMAGPFLLETLHGSKYQVLFHQPNVLLEDKPVGVFQWGIAPPWRCIELRLPLPKFLASAGRAGAARGAKKRVDAAQRAKDPVGAAEKAWQEAQSLQQGMDAIQELEAARKIEPSPQQRAAALEEENDALNQEERRQAWLASEERQRSARQAERAALEGKRECDRLSRRGRQVADEHEAEASAAAELAQRSSGSEQAKALAVAKEQRARAAATRQSARAWQQEADLQEQTARSRRKDAREERTLHRQREEALAKASGKKKVNPAQQASGQSNAGLLAPSLFAHLPFPATVEIQVSWSQIAATWIAGLVGAAAEALKYYVGFVFDGVLAPGQSKGTTFLLDLAKSVINDTLIDSGAKYLTGGTWAFHVNKKLGPVKVVLQLEPDPATGSRAWKATIEHKSQAPVLGAASIRGSLQGHGGTLDKATVEGAGQRAEHTFTKPPVDYAHGVPTVN